VSVHLLVASRSGQLPFVRLVPEGFEDLDCLHADGRSTFVQMKEVGGGAGRLTAADAAEALAHADAASGGESLIAVVTDGELGSGLVFTGWNGAPAAQGGQPAQDVVDHLVSRGMTAARASALVGRARLISLPWNVRGETERLLAEALRVHPAVASFAVGHLYGLMGQTASDQRFSARDSALAHAPADVDAAVAVVQSAVDVRGLDAAVAAGVCEPADYLHPSGLSARQFYLGIDGAPAHIAANLDVLRVREMLQIVQAVRDQRYALVLGPSGAGKSVLLWRAARDAVLGARVVRVRQAGSPEQADLLVRHVRLLQPRTASPVVVAADNLGRSAMAAWAAAVDKLRELPDVLLIAACRAEDFHPALVCGSARIIEPSLDDQTAILIADKIQAAGTPLRMAASEAHSRSEGLLMEFVALLTTGQRLEQVLAEQAEGLRRPDRRLQRTAARLLTAAHSLGLSLPADRLGAALAGRPGAPDPEAVGDALDALDGEHIIIRDGMSWRGLHELRSQKMTEFLHQSPPPTLAATYATIVPILSPADAGWLMRRVAEHVPHHAHAVAAAAAEIVSSPGVDAAQAAQLLEGAERADNALYARECLPILKRHLRPGTTVHQLATFVYGMRHQGLWQQPHEVPQFEAMRKYLAVIAQWLPHREITILATAASSLTAERILALTRTSSMADVTRLLEAASGVMKLSADAVAELFNRVKPPQDLSAAEAYARLIEALAGYLEAGIRDTILGTPSDRAVAVMRADPSAVAVTTAEGGRMVTATIMLPPHDPGAGEVPAWDIIPRHSDDQANTAAVSAARRLAAACPEADVIEVVITTPSGAPFRIAGAEWGHKRMPREEFVSRTGLRRSIGFQAAIRRLTASQSWTDLITQQIEIARELINLVHTAPARLKPADNSARRRDWTEQARTQHARAAALASQPTSVTTDGYASHARADDADRQQDKTSSALAKLCQAIIRLVDDDNRIGQAAAIRDAVMELEKAREHSNPALADLGQPVPDRLINSAKHLGSLLTVIHRDPPAAQRIRSNDINGSVASILADAASSAHQQQRVMLDAAIASVPEAALSLVSDPDPMPPTIDGTAWLITAPAESWNSLVDALREIGEETRAALTCNVMALATDGHNALPIGIRLTITGDHRELPIPQETIRQLTRQVSLTLPDQSPSAATIMQVIDALNSLSWRAALVRQRPGSWPNLPDPALPDISQLREHAAAAARSLPEGLADQAGDALTTLIDQVAAELAGTAAVSLSGEIYDSQGHGSPAGTPAPQLWAALQFLSATMMAMR
jgi:hypothetical protein